MSDVLHLYNLSMGALALVGFAYLLYAYRFVPGVRRFSYTVVAGFFLFAVAGPIVDLFAPWLAHAVHGVAALLVLVGLYTVMHADLRPGEWQTLLFREPSELRHPGDWMVPMDDAILELFHSADLVLTPAIIAYNIDHSREEVNRRLTELVEHDLVDRVDRGKYRITAFGERYLQGDDADRASGIDGRRSDLTLR